MGDKIKLILALEATAGGTRKHLLDVALNLDQDIFDISVICSTRRDPRFLEDIERMRSRNITIEIVEMTRTIHPVIDLMAFFKIMRYFRRHSFDILHAHSSKAGFICRMAAKFTLLSPAVYSPHCYYFHQKKGASRWFFLQLERFAGRFTDRIVAVSEGERKLTIDERIAAPSDVVCITNGIAVSRYDIQPDVAGIKKRLGIDPDSPVVGTVSRFSRQKGYKYFFRAASIVKERYPNAVFLFIGQDKSAGAAQSVLDELGISGGTILIDHCDFIQDYLSVMDVFVLSSLWEGRPYALLEAMAMKKPVVASDITGVNEVVRDRRTGYLVAAGDAEALASGIGKVLDDPAASAKMGEEGRRIIERDFTIETQIKTLTKLYLDLARGKNGGGSHAA